MYTDHDVIILGSGCAGLTAAIYTGRAGLDTLVLESKIMGGEMVNRQMIENYPGFGHGVIGTELSQQMLEQAETFGAAFENGEAVEIRDKGKFKIVKTEDESMTCKAIIIATGCHPRLLNVPGEKELAGKGVFYCATCDGAQCAGKPVVVSGGGSSSLTEALYLAQLGCKVTIVCRSKPRAEQILQDRVEENENIELLCNTDITEILGSDWVSGVKIRDKESGEEKTLDVQGIFIRIGLIANTGFLEDTIDLTSAGQIPVNVRMETELPGVYAAGDIRIDSPKQMATAVGDGATAAMACCEYINTL